MIDSNIQTSDSYDIQLTLDVYEQGILERGIRAYQVMMRLERDDLHHDDPDRYGFEEVLMRAKSLLHRLQAASKATSPDDYDIQFTVDDYEQIITHRALRIYQAMMRLNREDVHPLDEQELHGFDEMLGRSEILMRQLLMKSKVLHD